MANYFGSFSDTDYDDQMVDYAKEEAKEARHNARYTIEITGTEANLIMNELRSTYKPGCPADLKVRALQKKFWDLYFLGKWQKQMN